MNLIIEPNAAEVLKKKLEEKKKQGYALKVGVEAFG
jgi:Fe-S cluster assembly iron-binding protein IscA